MEVAAPGVIITEPLGFLDMSVLVHEASVVHTDSGGLQKGRTFIACRA